MAVINLPPDPRYTGWDKALASFGIGLQGLGEQRQKKGLLELTLMQEYGGVIPVGEVSKTAKRVGLDEGTLLRIMEPVHADAGSQQPGDLAGMNKPIVAYKLESRSERMLKAMRGSEMLKEELAKLFAEEKIKREAERISKITAAEEEAKKPGREAEIQARKEIAGTAAETSVTTTEKRIESAEKIAEKQITATKELTEYKVKEAKEAVKQAQGFEEEVLRKKEIYRQAMTREQQAEIGLKNAHVAYYNAYANFLETGGKDAKNKMADAYKRLETLGLTDPETKALKPFVAGSKELEAAKAVFKTAGIAYEEISGAGTEYGWGFLTPNKDQVLLVPKGEQPYTATPGTATNPDISALSKSTLSVDKTTLTLPNGQKLNVENGTVTYKGKKYRVE